MADRFWIYIDEELLKAALLKSHLRSYQNHNPMILRLEAKENYYIE